MRDEILSQRYPTAAARQALAVRLQLPYSDVMQDWEVEVATARRFNEFVDLYRSGALSEDEKFSLMEILVQCVEELHEDARDQSIAALAWGTLRQLLLQRPDLHMSTIKYWACESEADRSAQFAISQHMRELIVAIDG